MSHNMPTLLATAAEMRAVGSSWDSIAKKVHRKPKTCQKWPARFPHQWDQLYRDAHRRRFEETDGEIRTILRSLIRSDDPKIQARMTELWMRWGARAYGP